MAFLSPLDLYGSDAAGVWEVSGPLSAGVVLFHNWAHPAVREGPERSRQEPTQRLRGHLLPAAEQRRLPHVCEGRDRKLSVGI